MLRHQERTVFNRSDVRPDGYLDPESLPVSSMVALFERYGICGLCKITCARGLISILDLSRQDKIITRKGSRSANFLMVNSQDGNSESSPKTALMNRWAMGDKLPDEPIAAGRNNSVVRYFSSKEIRRPSQMKVDLSDINSPGFFSDCDVSELCIIVFDEAVEVLVQGVYILCPGVSDIRELQISKR